MAAIIRKNERSWAIELITQINQFSSENDLIIKRAGGETTVSERRGEKMFPDVVLFGDRNLSSILQGWELKMPDVPISDSDFVNDAQRKARALNLNSCVIWNFTHAKLYVLNANGEFDVKREWDNVDIKTRDDVQFYKSKWEKTLKNVLTSVNEYLISGEVKKSFIGDVLSKKSISNLINDNKFDVAYCLKKKANENVVIKAELETWWNEIKNEYKGDEKDKYSAYAKSIIINWTNRIIFAHLIKHRQMSAFAIENLKYDSTPNDGNKIFQSITEKSDFYNIFTAIPYNECISQKTWNALIELSIFLTHSPIKDISQEILQQVLEESVRETKRLVNGQYPTPPILAEILSRMTIHNVLGECFDGCCGTGTIPSFIINYKKKSIGASKALNTTWACDKFNLPLQIANLAMTSYDTINIPCRLFQKDILTLKVGDKVEIVNPNTGVKESYELPQFDAIISNLPFVQAKNIPDDDLKIVDIMTHANQLSGRADYSHYIALYLNSLVKEGGYVGLILSNSFLGTAVGEHFLVALKNYFDDMRIHISGSGKWFNNADVVTVLLIMRRKNVEENSNISFFTWKRNLYNIANNPELQEIIVNSSLLDKEIDGDVVRRVSYTEDEITDLRNLNISYNAFFADLKWLVNINDKIIPLTERFNVIRGSRRGCDNLFFPPENSGIEPLFLKEAVKNLKKTNKFITLPNSYAFNCDMSLEELEENNYNGALSWIKRFENIKDKYGPLPKRLKRANVEWYDLIPNEIAELGTMMNPGNRLFYVKFPTPTFINQRIIGLNRRYATDNIDLLLALLNSILSLFYIEAVGFGRGLGALDNSKESISKTFMLNPALLTDKDKTDILNKFALLIKRGIVDIEHDLDDPIRQEFDKTVLNAYGIGNYYDDIVNSLKNMRRIRMAPMQKITQLKSFDGAKEYKVFDKNILKAADNNIEN